MSVTVFTKARTAFRSRALTLAIATATGSFTCAGYVYSRAAGSFLDDGFAVGDVINASGFSAAGNGYARITAVTSTAMTVDRALGTGSGVAAVIKAGLPAQFAWEGLRFMPTAGQPFVAETLLPVGAPVSAIGQRARIKHVITHTLTLFYPSNEGPGPMERVAGGLLDHFRPGTSLDVSPAQGIVMQAERRALLVEPDWSSLPVLITVNVFSD